MKNIRLNAELVKNICSLFPQPRADVIKATGIPPSTFYDMKKNTGDITIGQILSIANGLHIPVRRLFSVGNETFVGQKEDYVAEPYLTCSYNEKGIEEYINTHRKATWKAASQAVGMTWQGLRESLLSGRRFPVARFLSICNRLNIDPFSILIDPNPEKKKSRRAAVPVASPSAAVPVASPYAAVPVASPTGTLPDIAALNKRMAALETTVSELKSKYESLLESHKELLRRVQVNIDTISGSYIGNIGMAAEQLASCDTNKK